MFADLRRTGPSQLLLIASGAFGLLTVRAQLLAVMALPVGVACLAAATGRDKSSARDLTPIVVGMIAIFSIMLIAGPLHEEFGSPPGWISPVAGFSWLGLGIVWLAWRRYVRMRQLIFILILALTAALGIIHVTSASDTGLDVFWLHESAATAIADGQSPYSEAVTVPNGAPGGEPFIVGYPYPPATAVSYSVGAWLGDARWTSLVAWLVVLAIIGARSLHRNGSDLPLGVMVASAAMPGWPLVLAAAWTEPLSLALIAVVTVAWSRSALFGGAVGLLFGSKQYLLAGTPLLATGRVPARWTRMLWAGVVLVLSFVPVLIWGVPEFIDAAIRFHLEAPPRPDGTSIVGLLSLFSVDWTTPTWLMVGLVIVVAVVFGLKATNLGNWLAALGVILSVALFLSPQAFPNYWFLIAGIAALGAVASIPSESSRMAAESGSADSALADRSAS